MRNRLTVLGFIAFVACQSPEKVRIDFYSTNLFKEVQSQAIFPDSKTFVDCASKKPIDEVVKLYEAEKSKPGFDLKKFVEENFEPPQRPKSTFKSDSLLSMEDHLKGLWPVLTRKPDDYNENSSLLALPNQYIVPGGRFSEIYYWDSYFTMLGLKSLGRFDLINDMVDNFAFLIDSVGFIPNGNRNYYLSRSQPPFFSLMVKLVAENDSTANLKYLPQLQKEYNFWMNGVDKLQKPGDQFEHVVIMPDGTILNRYFDKNSRPRPEAFKEDVKVAQRAANNPETARDPDIIYNGLRSAAESGWDFSSRWLKDGQTLESIQTIDIIPVDLNCLMYHMELMLSNGYKMKNDAAQSTLYKKKANERRRGILTFFWSADQNFFLDYNFKDSKQSSVKSLAGMYPVFFNLPSGDLAIKASETLKKDFLKPGGLVTTLNNTGQQWDFPNGWAPLQWIAYKGLKDYQIHTLADEIKKRWLKQNNRVYKATHKMMEKYNVMDTTLQAGGGEYPNQDGFGWTNGVALAMMNYK
jgi:alpha,alpha-trehalase